MKGNKIINKKWDCKSQNYANKKLKGIIFTKEKKLIKQKTRDKEERKQNKKQRRVIW